MKKYYVCINARPSRYPATLLQDINHDVEGLAIISDTLAQKWIGFRLQCCLWWSLESIIIFHKALFHAFCSLIDLRIAFSVWCITLHYISMLWDGNGNLAFLVFPRTSHVNNESVESPNIRCMMVLSVPFLAPGARLSLDAGHSRFRHTFCRCQTIRYTKKYSLPLLSSQLYTFSSVRVRNGEPKKLDCLWFVHKKNPRFQRWLNDDLVLKFDKFCFSVTVSKKFTSPISYSGRPDKRLYNAESQCRC